VVVGHLKSATYQRLMLAILAKNCLYLAAFALVSTAAAAAAAGQQASTYTWDLEGWHHKHTSICLHNYGQRCMRI
jgi:hypothetical protein